MPLHKRQQDNDFINYTDNHHICYILHSNAHSCLYKFNFALLLWRQPVLLPVIACLIVWSMQFFVPTWNDVSTPTLDNGEKSLIPSVPFYTHCHIQHDDVILSHSWANNLQGLLVQWLGSGLHTHLKGPSASSRGHQPATWWKPAFLLGFTHYSTKTTYVTLHTTWPLWFHHLRDYVGLSNGCVRCRTQHGVKAVKKHSM